MTAGRASWYSNGMHKSQVFLMVLLAFLIGIGVGSFWAISSTTLLVLVGVATLVLGVSAYHRTFGPTPRGARRRKLGFLAGCLLLVFVLGVWRFNVYHAEHSIVAEFANRTVGGKALPVVMVGYVDGDVQVSGSKASFAFRVKEIVVPNRIIFADEDILVYASASLSLRYGDILRLEGPIVISENNDYIIANYPRVELGALAVPLSWWERCAMFIYRAFH